MTEYLTYIPNFDDPYPEQTSKITGFEFRNALVLVRLTDAIQVPHGHDAFYVVAADYVTAWRDENGVPHELVVPRGMLTDLTSVPPVFRWLVNRVGPWLEAAIVHDFLTIAWKTMDGRYTDARRQFADEIMYAAMEAAEVRRTKRAIIYFGVRAWAMVNRVFKPKDVDPDAQTHLYLDQTDRRVQVQFDPDVALPGPSDGQRRRRDGR
ncbi:MAG: DUF1353 domain-containing protein [Pseudomonadota bacterium]